MTNTTNAAINFGGAGAATLGLVTVPAAVTTGAGLTLAPGELMIDVDGAGAGAAVNITGTFTTAADLRDAINTQTSSTIATLVGGEVRLTNTSTTNQIGVTGSQAATLGLATVNAATPAGTNGLTLGAGDLTFDLDGAGGAAAVSVTGNFTTMNDLRDAINAATSSSIASIVGGELRITNADAVNAITIGGARAAAMGLATVPAATGVTLGAGEFTVDGNDITGTFATVSDLATAITGAGITGVTASVQGGELRITNASGADITLGGAFATALGIAATVVDGTDEDSTTATAALATSSPTTDDSAGVAAMVAATGGAQVDGTSTSTTRCHGGCRAWRHDEQRHRPTTAWTPAVTATGTPTPQTFTVGQFNIQIGTNPLIDFAGTYQTYDELVAAINSKVGGVYAAMSTRTVFSRFDSGDVVTIGGTRAGVGCEQSRFRDAHKRRRRWSGSDRRAVVRRGQRFDPAHRRGADRGQHPAQHAGRYPEPLSVDDQQLVGGLREPVCLAQPNSRHGLRGRNGGDDCAQILQQAGTAMVAQANAVPQNVLSLLK